MGVVGRFELHRGDQKQTRTRSASECAMLQGLVRFLRGLEQGGKALTATDAHGHDPVALALALELPQE